MSKRSSFSPLDIQMDNDVKATYGAIKFIADNINKVNNYYNTNLGEGATNPVTRRDGSPLLGGEMFFNTQTRMMLVYYKPLEQWIQTPGGQFVDAGTTIGSGIQYMAQISGVEDIIVRKGTNAFSVESFELANGATLTIEDGAVYKIL